MTETKKRNGFASGIGFILAAAGSAVGLGNLWGFPYKTAKYGGAAFVLVYILCVLFIGIIAMIAEVYLGKRSQSNTITAFKKVNNKMGWAGMLAIIIPTFIICYYSVLGGWTVRFTVNSFQPNEALSNANSFGSFISNPYTPVIFTSVFLIISAIIIMGGVKEGIEKASKVLMPALFIIVVLIAIYALCLGSGVMEGLNFYLNPDFSKLGFEGVLAAMGQAFYSLSLGMGIMIAYGSYTGNEIKIGKSAIMICAFDTAVALIAGLAIFTSIGHFNPEAFKEGSGVALQSVGLMYQTLPQVFASLGWFGKIVYVIMLPLFAFTTILAWAYYGEKSVDFLFRKTGKKGRKISTIVFKVLYVVLVFVAALMVALGLNGDLAWAISDTANGLMALPNLVGLVFMCVLVAKITKNYFDRKKGKDVAPMLSVYEEQNEEFVRELKEDEAVAQEQTSDAKENQEEVAQ